MRIISLILCLLINFNSYGDNSDDFINDDDLFKSPPKKSILKVDQIDELTSEQLDNLTYKLLIFSTVVSNQSEDLISIPKQTIDEYVSLRNKIALQLAGSGGAYSTVAYGDKSGEFMMLTSQLMQISVKAMFKYTRISSTMSANSMEAIGLEFVVESLGSSLDRVYGIAGVTGQFLLNNKMSVTGSSAVFSIGAIGLAYSMGTSDVLTYDKARDLLGYNKQFREKLNSLVDQLGLLLFVKNKDKAKLREHLYTEIIEQAIKNDFDPTTKIKIDLKKIVKVFYLDKNVIDIVQKYREMYQIVNKKKITDEESLTVVDKVDNIISLSLLLEEALASSKHDGKYYKEIVDLLLNVKRSLKVIEKNMSVVPDLDVEHE